MTNDLDITTGGYKRLNGGAPSDPLLDSSDPLLDSGNEPGNEPIYKHTDLEANAIYNFFVLGSTSGSKITEIQEFLDKLIKDQQGILDELKEKEDLDKEKVAKTMIAFIKQLKIYYKSKNDLDEAYDGIQEIVNGMVGGLETDSEKELSKLYRNIYNFISELRKLEELFEYLVDIDGDQYMEQIQKILKRWDIIEGSDQGTGLGTDLGTDQGLGLMERNALAELNIDGRDGRDSITWAYKQTKIDRLKSLVSGGLDKFSDKFSDMAVKMIDTIKDVPLEDLWGKLNTFGDESFRLLGGVFESILLGFGFVIIAASSLDLLAENASKISTRVIGAIPNDEFMEFLNGVRGAIRGIDFPDFPDIPDIPDFDFNNLLRVIKLPSINTSRIIDIFKGEDICKHLKQIEEYLGVYNDDVGMIKRYTSKEPDPEQEPGQEPIPQPLRDYKMVDYTTGLEEAEKEIYNKFLKDIDGNYDNYFAFIFQMPKPQLKWGEESLSKSINSLIKLRIMVYNCSVSDDGGDGDEDSELNPLAENSDGGDGGDEGEGDRKPKVLELIDKILEAKRETHRNFIVRELAEINDKLREVINKAGGEEYGSDEITDLINSFNGEDPNREDSDEEDSDEEDSDNGIIQFLSNKYELDISPISKRYLLTDYILELLTLLDKININKFNKKYLKYLKGKTSDSKLAKALKVERDNIKEINSSLHRRPWAILKLEDDAEAIDPRITIRDSIAAYLDKFIFDCFLSIEAKEKLFRLITLIHESMSKCKSDEPTEFVLLFTTFINYFSKGRVSTLSDIVDKTILDWIFDNATLNPDEDHELLVQGCVEILGETKEAIQDLVVSRAQNELTINGIMKAKIDEFIECFVKNAETELKKINESKKGEKLNKILKKLTTISINVLNQVADSGEEDEEETSQKLYTDSLNKKRNKYETKEIRLFEVEWQTDFALYDEHRSVLHYTLNILLGEDKTEDILKYDGGEIRITGATGDVDGIKVKATDLNDDNTPKNSSILGITLSGQRINIDITDLMKQIINYHAYKEKCRLYQMYLKKIDDQLEEQYLWWHYKNIKPIENGTINTTGMNEASLTDLIQTLKESVTVVSDANTTDRPYINKYIGEIQNILDALIEPINGSPKEWALINNNRIYRGLESIKKSHNTDKCNLEQYKRFKYNINHLYELKLTVENTQGILMDKIRGLTIKDFSDKLNEYKEEYIYWISGEGKINTPFLKGPDITGKVSKDSFKLRTLFRENTSYGYLINEIHDILNMINDIKTKNLEEEEGVYKYKKDGDYLAMTALRNKIDELKDHMDENEPNNINTLILHDFESTDENFMDMVLEELNKIYDEILNTLQCEIKDDEIEHLVNISKIPTECASKNDQFHLFDYSTKVKALEAAEKAMEAAEGAMEAAEEAVVAAKAAALDAATEVGAAAVAEAAVNEQKTKATLDDKINEYVDTVIKILDMEIDTKIQYQLERQITETLHPQLNIDYINEQIKKIHEELDSRCNTYLGSQYLELFNGGKVNKAYYECLDSKYSGMGRAGNYYNACYALYFAKIIGIYYRELIKYKEYYYYSYYLNDIIEGLNEYQGHMDDDDDFDEDKTKLNDYCDILIQNIEYHEKFNKYFNEKSSRYHLRNRGSRVGATPLTIITVKEDEKSQKEMLLHYQYLYKYESRDTGDGVEFTVNREFYRKYITSKEVIQFKKDIVGELLTVLKNFLKNLKKCKVSPEDLEFFKNMRLNFFNQYLDIDDFDDKYNTPVNRLYNVKLKPYVNIPKITRTSQTEQEEGGQFVNPLGSDSDGSDDDDDGGDDSGDEEAAEMVAAETAKHHPNYAPELKLVTEVKEKTILDSGRQIFNIFDLIDEDKIRKTLSDKIKKEFTSEFKQIKNNLNKKRKEYRNARWVPNLLRNTIGTDPVGSIVGGSPSIDTFIDSGKEKYNKLIDSSNELQRKIEDKYKGEKPEDLILSENKMINIISLVGECIQKINDATVDEILGKELIHTITDDLAIKTKEEPEIDIKDYTDHDGDYITKQEFYSNLVSLLYNDLIFNDFYYYDKFNEFSKLCSPVLKLDDELDDGLVIIAAEIKQMNETEKRKNKATLMKLDDNFDPTMPEYVKLSAEIKQLEEETIEKPEKVLPKIDYGDESEEKKVEEEVVEKEKEKETEDLEKPMDEEKRKPPISEKIDDIDEIKPVEEIEKPKQPRSYSPQRRSRKYYPESTIHKIDKPKKYEVKSKIEFTDKTVMRDREDDGCEDDDEDPFKIDDELDARLRLEEKIYLEKAKERNMKLKILLNEKLKQEMKKKEKELVTMNQYLSYSNLTFDEVKHKFELPNYETRQHIFLISDYFRGYTKEKINKEYVLGFLRKLDKEISYEEKQILIKISNYYNKTYPEKMLKHDLSQHTTSFNGVYSVLHTLIRVHKDLPKILCKTLR